MRLQRRDIAAWTLDPRSPVACWLTPFASRHRCLPVSTTDEELTKLTLNYNIEGLFSGSLDLCSVLDKTNYKCPVPAGPLSITKTFKIPCVPSVALFHAATRHNVLRMLWVSPGTASPLASPSLASSRSRTSTTRRLPASRSTSSSK